MFASQKVGIEVSHFHGPHMRAGIKVGISLSQARTNSDSTFRDSGVCLCGYGNQVPLLRASLFQCHTWVVLQPGTLPRVLPTE